MKPEPFPLPERQRLWECPPVQNHFPIRFSDGCVWEQLTGSCANCKTDIPAPCFRGEVLRLFADIYNIKAVGFCAGCQLVTCFQWRLKSDSLSGLANDGQFHVWPARPARPLRSFIHRWFKRLFSAT